MNTSSRPVAVLASAAVLVMLSTTASAVPPRSERIANRAAERAYARRSIAEARAARAEARVADIAPRVPVPPPPRPATVRRMRRAGVPLVAQPPLVGQAPLAGAAPLVTAAPVTPAEPPRVIVDSSPAGRPADRPGPSAAAAATPAPAVRAPGEAATPPADVADDGTRSVLAAGEQPSVVDRAPAGPTPADPPIELLPTPPRP